jgi:hypothetical protein
MGLGDASSGTMFIPNLMKINELVQNLKEETHRGDHIRLFLQESKVG